MQSSNKIRIAVFASGGGSNLRAIYRATQTELLKNAEVALVISNNSTSGAMLFAGEKNIPAKHISAMRFGSLHEAAIAISQTLHEYEIQCIVLAGYMKKLPESVVEEFAGRIINIHPSLLPKHGGEGMYGIRVHEAVLASGDRETGATVHFVEGDYDTGKVIMQERCAVGSEDTPESLQNRVKELEHKLLPKAIAQLVSVLTSPSC